MAQTIRDELPDGWTAVYHIGPDASGATVITGLTLEPTDRTVIPDGGLTTGVLRSVPMGVSIRARTWTDVHEQFPTWGALKESGMTWGDVRHAVRITDERPPPRRGRRHDEQFLLEVAQIYDGLVRDETATDVYSALIDELRQRGFEYRRAGARELVRKARGRGLLSPTIPGRAGGGLTAHAKRLLAKADKTTKR